MDAERQKHLDQLLKLLALAQGTNFAAEAESARGKAEELMRRYNLSAEEGSKDRSRFESYDWEATFKRAQWEFIIAHVLGKLCGCEVYWYGDFQSYTAAGSIADLEAFRYMLDEIRRQRIAAWLEYKKTGPDKLWAFCFAYARALEAKIATLLVGAAEIEAQRQRAIFWYESTHHITRSNPLLRGRGTSEAGRTAGGAASLHRGAVGQTARQITHRR